MKIMSKTPFEESYKVVLQKLVEDRKLLRKGINYATTPKIWLMKKTRSLTAAFATP